MYFIQVIWGSTGLSRSTAMPALEGSDATLNKTEVGRSCPQHSLSHCVNTGWDQTISLRGRKLFDKTNVFWTKTEGGKVHSHKCRTDISPIQKVNQPYWGQISPPRRGKRNWLCVQLWLNKNIWSFISIKIIINNDFWIVYTLFVY